MSKEKIKEMAKVLIDYTKKNNIMASHVILEDYAESLYNAGYRKQVEVEWTLIMTVCNRGECTKCGEIGAVRWKYCPNCGAHMRKEDEGK